jgi:hypothetical protein
MSFLINPYTSVGLSPFQLLGSKSYSGNKQGTFAVSLTDILDESGSAVSLRNNDFVVIVEGVGCTGSQLESEMLASGYTAAHAQLYSNDSVDAQILVQHKFMGSTPDTSVAMPDGNASAHSRAGTVFAFRGVDLTTPIEAITTASGGNTRFPNPPSVTPLTTGGAVLVTGTGGHQNETALSMPAGLSTTTNHFQTPNTTAYTIDCSTFTGVKLDWEIGAVDIGAAGGTGDDVQYSWVAVSLAIKPAIPTVPTLGDRAPAGDAQSGSDKRVPAGDMNAGSDIRQYQETI